MGAEPPAPLLPGVGWGVVNSESLGAGFPHHHALAGSLPYPDPASPTPNWSPIMGVLAETI